MDTAYFIPLPVILKQPMNPEPRSTVKTQLHFMVFNENNYPTISNTEIWIVRSSPGGLSFRLFPGKLTNTIDLRGAPYGNLYLEVKKPILDGMAQPRGIICNHWNFDRFAFFYNNEVVPATKGLAFPQDIVDLFRNNQQTDDTLSNALVFAMMAVGKFRLNFQNTLKILKREPGSLKAYQNNFSEPDQQLRGSQIIFAYWIIEQFYIYQNGTP